MSLAACAADVPPTGAARVPLEAPALPSGARRLVALPGAELVALRTLFEAPEGAGDPTQLALGVVRGGQVTPLELPSPALGAVAWGDVAAVLSVDGTLRRVGADALPVLVARDVVTEPAVSDDGRVLAYVAHDGSLGYALRVLEAGRTRTIARDVPHAGALRFSPDVRTLVFIGASRGGVMGLHSLAVDAPPDGSVLPRCLTNCELVTGQPWGARFVPLPAGARALRFEGDDVLYDQVRVAFRGGAL
jgi:hypothetical protein